MRKKNKKTSFFATGARKKKRKSRKKIKTQRKDCGNKRKPIYLCSEPLKILLRIISRMDDKSLLNRRKMAYTRTSI